MVFWLNYKKIKRLTTSTIKDSVFYLAVQQVFVCMFAYFANVLFKSVFGGLISLFLSGIIAVSVFAITYYIFFVLKEKDETEPYKTKLT